MYLFLLVYLLIILLCIPQPSASKCKDILDLDIVSLREKMKAGELNPKEVLYAYQDKVSVISLITDAVTFSHLNAYMF